MSALNFSKSDRYRVAGVFIFFKFKMLRCKLKEYFCLIVAARERRSTVPCVENGRFYRNPKQSPRKAWVANECAKYYLCLGRVLY